MMITVPMMITVATVTVTVSGFSVDDMVTVTGESTSTLSPSRVIMIRVTVKSRLTQSQALAGREPQ